MHSKRAQQWSVIEKSEKKRNVIKHKQWRLQAQLQEKVQVRGRTNRKRGKLLEERLEIQMQCVPCPNTPEEPQRNRSKVEERKDGEQLRGLEKRSSKQILAIQRRKSGRNSGADAVASSESSPVQGQVEYDPGANTTGATTIGGNSNNKSVKRNKRRRVRKPEAR